MDGRNENCAMNKGTMSLECKLDIKELEKNIKESFDSELEEIKEEIGGLKEELLVLKKDKADDSALREIKEELIKVQKELSKMSEANDDRKDDIKEINDRLNELFELLSEKNFQEGENAAMLQNMSDSIGQLAQEMRDGFKEQNIKIEKNKPLSWSQQISIFIDGKWYKKILVYLIGFMLFSFGFGAFAFYSGNQTTFLDIMEILKGFLS